MNLILFLILFIAVFVKNGTAKDKKEQPNNIFIILTYHVVDFIKKESKKDKPYFLYLTHKTIHEDFTPAPGIGPVQLPVKRKQELINIKNN